MQLAAHDGLEAWYMNWLKERELDGGLGLEELVIRLHLVEGSAMAAYEPVNLDNLLGFGVVLEATQGQLLGDPPPGCAGWSMHLPLAMAWESPEGLPLWNSTVFWPCPSPGSRAVGDVLYFHKRMPLGIWAKGDAKTGRLGGMNGATGRWMERRTPIPVTLCDTWEARCVGHRVTVERLLSLISFVGKKRNVGLGEVKRWEILSAESSGSILVRDGVLQRPIPVDAANQLGIEIDEAPSRIGWTCPQWKKSLSGDGWQAGAKVIQK